MSRSTRLRRSLRLSAIVLGLAGCAGVSPSATCAEGSCPSGTYCGPAGACLPMADSDDAGVAQPVDAAPVEDPALPVTAWTCGGGGHAAIRDQRRAFVTVGGAPAGRWLVGNDGRRLRLGRLTPGAF